MHFVVQWGMMLLFKPVVLYLGLVVSNPLPSWYVENKRVRDIYNIHMHIRSLLMDGEWTKTKVVALSNH